MMNSQINKVIIDSEEYKKLILDSELITERQKLQNLREKLYKEKREYRKCIEDEVKSKIGSDLERYKDMYTEYYVLYNESERDLTKAKNKIKLNDEEIKELKTKLNTTLTLFISSLVAFTIYLVQ